MATLETIPPITTAFLESSLTVTGAVFTAQNKNILHSVEIITPTWDNTVTVSLSLQDANGVEVWNSGAVSKSTKVVLPSTRPAQAPLVGFITPVFTFTGAPGGVGISAFQDDSFQDLAFQEIYGATGRSIAWQPYFM